MLNYTVDPLEQIKLLREKTREGIAMIMILIHHFGSNESNLCGSCSNYWSDLHKWKTSNLTQKSAVFSSKIQAKKRNQASSKA